MMFNENTAALWLAVIGVVLAFILWAFGAIPWWAIFLGALAAPVGVAVLVLVFALLWSASGSH